MTLVSRAGLVVMCVLFALQAVGAARALAAIEAASDCCANERSDTKRCPAEGSEECPVDCQLCFCCSSSPRALTSLSMAILPITCQFELVPSWLDESPPSPDPHEILHVPKLTLA